MINYADVPAKSSPVVATEPSYSIIMSMGMLLMLDDHDEPLGEQQCSVICHDRYPYHTKEYIYIFISQK